MLLICLPEAWAWGREGGSREVENATRSRWKFPQQKFTCFGHGETWFDFRMGILANIFIQVKGCKRKFLKAVSSVRSLSGRVLPPSDRGTRPGAPLNLACPSRAVVSRVLSAA